MTGMTNIWIKDLPGGFCMSDYVDIKQAIELAGKGESTITRAIRTKKVHAHQKNGKWLILRSDLVKVWGFAHPSDTTDHVKDVDGKAVVIDLLNNQLNRLQVELDAKNIQIEGMAHQIQELTAMLREKDKHTRQLSAPDHGQKAGRLSGLLARFGL